MRRRDVLSLLGGAAASWPRAVRAQQSGKLRVIGVLGTNAFVWKRWTEAFAERLRELGWIEGRTVAIEYRWDEGRADRDPEIAGELVRLNVDIILTNGSAVAVVEQATSVIPIVFAISNDPVGTGLVASLARPGVNVTGLSTQATDVVSKRLELLREIVPHLRRLAIIGNAGYPDAVLEMAEVERTARAVGLEATRIEVRAANDIPIAFQTLSSAHALFVVSDALVGANRKPIIGLPSTSAYQRSSMMAALSEAAASCLTGRTLRDCSDAMPSLSTKSCVRQSLLTFPSSSRLSSRSSSTSRPRTHARA